MVYQPWGLQPSNNATWLGGPLTFDGQTYNFGSGGRGYGSIPPGNYNVSKYFPAYTRTGDRQYPGGFPLPSFSINDDNPIPDARMGATQAGNRLGILIHPGSATSDVKKILSAGCVAINRSQWPAFQQAVQAGLKKYGSDGLVLSVDANGQASIHPKGAYAGPTVSPNKAANLAYAGAPQGLSAADQAAKEVAQGGRRFADSRQNFTPDEIAATRLAPRFGDNAPARTMRSGMKGPDVRQLQTNLALNGYNPGPVDGRYGNKTAQAVKAFERANRLPQDRGRLGVAGPQVLGALQWKGPITPGDYGANRPPAPTPVGPTLAQVPPVTPQTAPPIRNVQIGSVNGQPPVTPSAPQVASLPAGAPAAAASPPPAAAAVPPGIGPRTGIPIPPVPALGPGTTPPDPTPPSLRARQFANDFAPAPSAPSPYQGPAPANGLGLNIGVNGLGSVQGGQIYPPGAAPTAPASNAIAAAPYQGPAPANGLGLNVGTNGMGSQQGGRIYPPGTAPSSPPPVADNGGGINSLSLSNIAPNLAKARSAVGQTFDGLSLDNALRNLGFGPQPATAAPTPPPGPQSFNDTPSGVQVAGISALSPGVATRRGIDGPEMVPPGYGIYDPGYGGGFRTVVRPPESPQFLPNQLDQTNPPPPNSASPFARAFGRLADAAFGASTANATELPPGIGPMRMPQSVPPSTLGFAPPDLPNSFTPPAVSAAPTAPPAPVTPPGPAPRPISAASGSPYFNGGQSGPINNAPIGSRIATGQRPPLTMGQRIAPMAVGAIPGIGAVLGHIAGQIAGGPGHVGTPYQGQYTPNTNQYAKSPFTPTGSGWHSPDFNPISGGSLYSYNPQTGQFINSAGNDVSYDSGYGSSGY